MPTRDRVEVAIRGNADNREKPKGNEGRAVARVSRDGVSGRVSKDKVATRLKVVEFKANNAGEARASEVHKAVVDAPDEAREVVNRDLFAPSGIPELRIART